ncbi:MAG TPA: ATP-dependent 6-phosphofructokinase [Gemmatimonadota bacterium]|nr:ATP-dependent 6-phosphofructokinase [Gemmatimonadota bacterium]
MTPASGSQPRLALLTSGGDAPGMNAAIRAVVRTAADAGWETIGFRRGYTGLLDDLSTPLSPRTVANVIQRGGSILETSRDRRFADPAMRERAREVLEHHGCRALIAIGGEGTQSGAANLQAEWEGSVLGVASTIDNDLGGTDQSIGFDTACNTALEAIDRIRDTANTLERLFFIEVMGRRRGFIALEVAVAGGAEAVLLPEVALDAQWLVEVVRRNYERGKLACIVVVAEGAHPGGARGLLHEMEEVSKELGLSGAGPRVTILGHIQRGGNPTVRDRVLASRLGMSAARAATEDQRDQLFGVRGNSVCATPFAVALSEKKEIDRGLLEMVNTLAG